MLPKKNRLTRSEVEEVFLLGRSIPSKSLVLKFFIGNNSKTRRVSFSVSKKISKRATVRNTIRRRGYSVVEKSFRDLPPGFKGVFVFKKDTSRGLLEEEIKEIIRKV